MGLKKVKLMCVSDQNNNKFYNMEEIGDGTFKATWGRVGLTEQSQIYPMNMWDKKYKSKINKPKGKESYTDVTHLFLESTNDVVEKPIDNIKVKTFIELLQRFSNRSIQNNYTVSSKNVTQKQIDEAQIVANEIADVLSVSSYNLVKMNDINQLFLRLYKIVPRKMKKVNDFLIDKMENNHDFSIAKKLLATEQSNLDVMAGQVVVNATTDDQQKSITILESLGLDISEIKYNEVAQVQRLMGRNINQYHSAFKVINNKTQKRFDNFVKKSQNKKRELFWHGSRNENWWSIMNTGMFLRPTNAVITGKMFGYGLYFADKCQKSIGYSSLRGSYWSGGSSNQGILALFDVHVGDQLKIQHHQSWCYDLTENKLRNRGNYDSLFALGGADLRNNEYIVYNEAQVTIKYIVEIR